MTPEAGIARWLEGSLAAVYLATELAARRDAAAFGSAVQRLAVGDFRAEVQLGFRPGAPFPVRARIELFNVKSGERVGSVFDYDPAGASVARESLNKCGSHGVSTDERGDEA